MYHLRQVQINAMTRYDYLGVIGLDRCNNGCVSHLKPPWHTRSEDLITRLKGSSLGSDLPCFQYDSVRNRRFDRYRIDIMKFENILPKDAFLTKIDPINLRSIRSRKVERQLRDLEKAHQVN